MFQILKCINIIVKALEEPVRQIATNAGVEGSVIIEKLRIVKQELDMMLYMVNILT